MKRLHIFLAVAAAALLWVGYRVYRAHANLVTLHVRGMDVRRVIPKIEWQTWERILVNKDVAGNVTLDVDSVPLDEVLNIIGLQTNARWTRLYPIYLTGKSAVDFKKVVRGDIPLEGSGWTNLLKNPFWQRRSMGGFGNTARAANNLVSAQFVNKNLDFAALALSRFSQAQVVPEDSAHGTINLQLAQVPFEKAVAKVAGQVRRKWDEIYALSPLQAPKVARKPVEGAQESTLVVTQPEEPKRPPEEQVEAFLATMSPEEKQKAQAQIAAAEELRSLPPAERQQRMQEMAAQFAQNNNQADAEQRIQNRLKNGTVDQRIARDRQSRQKSDRGQQP